MSLFIIIVSGVFCAILPKRWRTKCSCKEKELELDTDDDISQDK